MAVSRALSPFVTRWAWITFLARLIECRLRASLQLRRPLRPAANRARSARPHNIQGSRFAPVPPLRMWSRHTTEAADSRPPLMLGKGRLEALSDGVFSIAMTLLVLELKVPEAAHQHSNAELLDQILALRTAFLSYVLTFLISGAFWYLHHLTFHFIRHTDRLLCWI